MSKIKIKIGVIGYLPFEFNRKVINKWKSNIFEIVGEIDDFHFNGDSDTLEWGYSDSLLSKELPIKYDGDFFVGITYVPLELNFYSRRLDNNRLVLSYYELHQILKAENIPVENLLLRLLYASCLVYLRNEQSIPKSTEWIGYTHDDTRGCLFDFNGNKDDIIYSLDKPTICDDCTNRIRAEKVPDIYITLIKKEINKITKGNFYKLEGFIKKRPIVSNLLSAAFGITLSLIASIIYGSIFNKKIEVQQNKMSAPSYIDSLSIKNESTSTSNVTKNNIVN
jgi:hypothetical protein